MYQAYTQATGDVICTEMETRGDATIAAANWFAINDLPSLRVVIEEINPAIRRAQALCHNESFCNGPGHPQGYDYEIHRGLFRGPYAKWLWAQAYSEARLEIAAGLGKAVAGPHGLNYTW